MSDYVDVKTEVLLDNDNCWIARQWMHGPDRPYMTVIIESTPERGWQRVRCFNQEGVLISEDVKKTHKTHHRRMTVVH